MFDSFGSQKQTEEIFKDYCTTLAKDFIGWTLHMIMCFLLHHPFNCHMLQLLESVRPISGVHFIAIKR